MVCSRLKSTFFTGEAKFGHFLKPVQCQVGHTLSHIYIIYEPVALSRLTHFIVALIEIVREYLHLMTIVLIDLNCWYFQMLREKLLSVCAITAEFSVASFLRTC